MVLFWSCEDEENCEEIYELRNDTQVTWDEDDSCNTSNYSVVYRDTPLPSSSYIKIEDNIATNYAVWHNTINNIIWLSQNGVYENFILKGDSLILPRIEDSCYYEIPHLIMSDNGWCIGDTEAEQPKEIYYYDCSLYPNKYVKICNPYQIGMPE